MINSCLISVAYRISLLNFLARLISDSKEKCFCMIMYELLKLKNDFGSIYIVLQIVILIKIDKFTDIKIPHFAICGFLYNFFCKSQQTNERATKKNEK